jgi:hypothetical protein
MTIPTGLGLTRGPESANSAGTPLAPRRVRAAANDAAFGGKDQSPDPCYCGKCNMTRSAV